MQGFRVPGLQGFSFRAAGFCIPKRFRKPHFSEFKGSRIPVFEFFRGLNSLSVADGPDWMLQQFKSLPDACGTFSHTLASVAVVGGEDCVRPFQLCVCGTVKVFGGAKNISHCINVTWGSWGVCACSSVRQLCASFASGLKKTIHNIPGDSSRDLFIPDRRRSQTSPFQKGHLL